MQGTNYFIGIVNDFRYISVFMKDSCTTTKEWHEYVAGCGSAIFNILCTFPAHKLMLRQQVDGVNIFGAFLQLKEEGVFKLYRGVAPPLIQKAAGLSIMFGCYHSLHNKLFEMYPNFNPILVQLLAAMAAGSIESLLTPFERMQTLLSISEHNDYVKVSNTLHTFLKIKKHYNLKEYYRGYSAILLRNGPSTALFFLLREPIKKTLPDVDPGFKDILEDFLSGAVLGTAISTLVYPLNVVKSNMQKSLGTEYRSIYSTFKEVYYLRGGSWKKMYLGVNINFSRSLISWGIINASYEHLKKLLAVHEPP